MVGRLVQIGSVTVCVSVVVVAVGLLCVSVVLVTYMVLWIVRWVSRVGVDLRCFMVLISGVSGVLGLTVRLTCVVIRLVWVTSGRVGGSCVLQTAWVRLIDLCVVLGLLCVSVTLVRANWTLVVLRSLLLMQCLVSVSVCLVCGRVLLTWLRVSNRCVRPRSRVVTAVSLVAVVDVSVLVLVQRVVVLVKCLSRSLMPVRPLSAATVRIECLQLVLVKMCSVEAKSVWVLLSWPVRSKVTLRPSLVTLR